MPFYSKNSRIFSISSWNSLLLSYLFFFLVNAPIFIFYFFKKINLLDTTRALCINIWTNIILLNLKFFYLLVEIFFITFEVSIQFYQKICTIKRHEHVIDVKDFYLKGGHYPILSTVNGFCILCRKDIPGSLRAAIYTRIRICKAGSTIQFYRWKTFTDPAEHGIYKEVDNITQRWRRWINLARLRTRF